jgi:glucose-6-phosphate 1-dehydrogenase
VRRLGREVKPNAEYQSEAAMSNAHSGALVFFGATGDLAYKKIFPALQAMIKRGHLELPVIGVASPDGGSSSSRPARRTASRSTAGSIARPSKS